MRSAIRGSRSVSATSIPPRASPYAFMMGEQYKGFSTAPPKDTPTPAATSSILSDADAAINLVATEEELQAEWKALERRVANRKPKINNGTSPSGRSARNSSAWDAENV